MSFGPKYGHLPWDHKLFSGTEIKKGAKVGKANGLTLLLDAETFDYMYTVGNSYMPLGP